MKRRRKEAQKEESYEKQQCIYARLPKIPRTKQAFQALRVGELKRIIHRAGFSWAGFLEKSEFVQQAFVASNALRIRDNTMPDDLSRKIATYLTDDDLFKMRGLNRVFYSAYYDQKIVFGSENFNFDRAVKLGNRGGVFKKLSYLEIDNWFRATDTIPSSEAFPVLRVFNNRLVSKRVLQKIPLKLARGLTTIEGNGHDLGPLHSCSFPNVKQLTVHDNVRRLDINPLPNLEKLVLNFRVTAYDFELICRAYFPKLEVVLVSMGYWGLLSNIMVQSSRLADEGIAVVLKFKEDG